MSRVESEPGGLRLRAGASLVEVMVALVVVEVGMLAMVALMRLAASETALARRVEVAQWDAAAVADSIVAGRLGSEGERIADWGTLRWSEADGTIRLEALSSAAGDREPFVRIHLARAEPDP